VADKAVVVSTITDICDKLSNPLTLSHYLRPAFWSALETLVDNLPGKYLTHYTEEDEEQLFGPIRSLGGSFVIKGIERKIKSLSPQSADYTDHLLQSIHEVVFILSAFSSSIDISTSCWFTSLSTLMSKPTKQW